ncbi:MAG: purine-cytosine permease-like protein [Cellvibrionaceae bacterium]|jgi:purine-cytosine permease-like protein
MASQTQTTYTARWYNRAGIWIGIGINPASITLGGSLAARLEKPTLIWVLPLGVFCLWAITLACGLIGRRKRHKFVEWSTATFGIGVGAVLINLSMALGMTGWSGFQMGLGGTSFANLMGINHATWFGVIAMGLLVLVLGNLEINKWNWFVWLTTLSSLAMALIATIIALRLDGSTPLDPRPATLGSIFSVITSIVAFASLFALRSTDFTWDLISDRDVFIDATLFICSFLISNIIGVMLYQATGSSDLAVVLSGTPLALLGKAFLFVSLLSPALSSMLSGSLAWSAVLKIKYWQATALLITTGVVLGLVRFDQSLILFLDWLAAIMPPAIAIMIVYGFSSRKFSTRISLAGWMVGAVIAIVIKLMGGGFYLAIGAAVGLLVLFISDILVRPTATVSN